MDRLIPPFGVGETSALRFLSAGTILVTLSSSLNRMALVAFSLPFCFMTGTSLGAEFYQRGGDPLRKKSKVTIKLNSHNILPKLESVATQRMFAAAQEVRNETIRTLSGNRTGRTYRVPGTQVTYTASAPGEAPAVQTGQLRNSVRDNVYKREKSVVGEVGTELMKGLWLEKGTKNMAPRPWLEVSFQRAQPRVREILSRRWF